MEFEFRLLKDFSAFTLSSIIEVLHTANRLHTRPIFSWTVKGAGICGSEVLRMETERPDESTRRIEAVVIVGPGEWESLVLPSPGDDCFKGLRYANVVMATGTAIAALAKCGMLESRTVAVHFQYIEFLETILPNLKISDDRVTVDGNVWSTPGDGAAIDAALQIVSHYLGKELAGKVSAHLGFGPFDRPKKQRMTPYIQFGMRNEKLAAAIRYIESLGETQFDTSVVSRTVGLSLRQLERLFQKYLFTTPLEFDRGIRLRRSRRLLSKTSMSILDVALSCGFVNPSHFARRFKSEFGESPSAHRNKWTRSVGSTERQLLAS